MSRPPQAAGEYIASVPGIEEQLAKMTLKVFSFGLAAAVSLLLTLSAYYEPLHSTHVAVLMVFLISLHLLKFRRIIWYREVSLYLCLLMYMSLSLIWTRNTDLAMNTMFPSLDFFLLLIMFGALIEFHDILAVLRGALCGFFAGIAFYTLTQGFPLSIPEDFSYNAIAGMYLYGLLLLLVYGCFRRSILIVPALSVFLMLHIVATTSIKTNLGMALGSVSAFVMYFRRATATAGRYWVILVCIGAAIAFAISTSDSALEKLQRGVDRISVGVEVLQAREDRPGYSAYAERDQWRAVGLEGWRQNPVFGYGVEAFRADVGITSHSTPIDLLYNSGLIGLVLFYSLFASIGWRLLIRPVMGLHSIKLLIFGSLICYSFMSLTEPLHYNGFFAAFVAISVSLIERARIRRAQQNPLRPVHT